MNPKNYAIANADEIASPALLFFEEIIDRNIGSAIEMAGTADKLRPHVKTHKCAEIVRKEMAQGILKHKCATITEAEMLAQAGVPDALIAYPLVGPNLNRLVRLIRAYPATSFAVLGDHLLSLERLSQAIGAAGLTVRVVLDLDVGQHRTGVALEDAGELYRLIGRLPGLVPDGFQVYDGHNTQPDRAEREKGAEAFLAPVLQLRSALELAGFPVPRLICGGTPSFPVHAGRDTPGLECSPGTFVLHDAGYGDKFADLAGFKPAAFVLTRVVSRPTRDRVTFDVGTKAIASDPPAGKRLKLLGFDNFTPVGHNEEHFIIETPEADRFQPGDVMLALPAHVCPTVALHEYANVVSNGRVAKQWKIAARNRTITI